MAEKIIKLLNISNPSLDERLDLLDELYWADWSVLDEEYPEEVDKIFQYLTSYELGIEEISKLLSLYNNIEGAHTDKFSRIIADYYLKDRLKFFKALNLNKDEAINLVYIFRMLGIFEEEEIEFEEVKSSGELSEEELGTARTFYTMYKTICHT